jgi:hypothetical protein
MHPTRDLVGRQRSLARLVELDTLLRDLLGRLEGSWPPEQESPPRRTLRLGLDSVAGSKPLGRERDTGSQ